MSKADHYRQKAAGANAMARAVDDIVAKRMWFGVSQNWTRMVPGAERAALQFDAAVVAKGTNQPQSTSKH